MTKLSWTQMAQLFLQWNSWLPRCQIFIKNKICFKHINKFNLVYIYIFSMIKHDPLRVNFFTWIIIYGWNFNNNKKYSSTGFFIYKSLKNDILKKL